MSLPPNGAPRLVVLEGVGIRQPLCSLLPRGPLLTNLALRIPPYLTPPPQVFFVNSRTSAVCDIEITGPAWLETILQRLRHGR
jgi:hypothetical protein